MGQNPNEHEDEEGEAITSIEGGFREGDGVVEVSCKFGHTIARANDDHDHGDVLLINSK